MYYSQSLQAVLPWLSIRGEEDLQKIVLELDGDSEEVILYQGPEGENYTYSDLDIVCLPLSELDNLISFLNKVKEVLNLENKND